MNPNVHSKRLKTRIFQNKSRLIHSDAQESNLKIETVSYSPVGNFAPQSKKLLITHHVKHFNYY